jgi:hypothetical protein
VCTSFYTMTRKLWCLLRFRALLLAGTGYFHTALKELEERARQAVCMRGFMTMEQDFSKSSGRQCMVCEEIEEGRTLVMRAGFARGRSD